MAETGAEKSRRTLNELLRGGRDERVDWAAVEGRLRSHPREAALRDGNGYPLEVALSRGCIGDAPPPAIVRATLDAHRAAAADTVGGGWTPLHTASHYRCGADVVGMVLEAFPEAAKMKDRGGRIPLHYASMREDVEVVRMLIRAHPEGVGVKNKRGWLPLHNAAWSEATPAIVRLLLNKGIREGVEGGSGGATVKDGWGKTPLDHACKEIKRSGMNEGKWEKVVLLALAATSTTAEVTDDGSVDVTPLSDRVLLPALHAVVGAGCPEHIVRHAITIANPSAGLMRDHHGRTALAVAASISEPNPEVVETLLSEGSGAEAARTADNDGCLPLHLAAESGWPYENGLEALINAEPRALMTRDVLTHMYPVMLAAAEPASNLDSAFRLLRANPSLVGWKENEA